MVRSTICLLTSDVSKVLPPCCFGTSRTISTRLAPVSPIVFLTLNSTTFSAIQSETIPFILPRARKTRGTFLRLPTQVTCLNFTTGSITCTRMRQRVRRGKRETFPILTWRSLCPI
uniref:Uncharacterized protein n=1 Tax=Cacopsylla melanoneura TaxID=428564 RepID=A0A8D8T6M6_9HEMI